VDAKTLREMLEQSFELSGSDPVKGHEHYADDAVLEFPQSGERFEGVENFREWRSQYPADTSFEFREIRGRDDLWIVELSVRYDGGAENFGVSIQEFRGDKIVRETIYVAEGWEPPEWRAKWRAAP
jgi:SnoaL-like protein